MDVNNLYMVKIQPFYNTIKDEYIHILTLNTKPKNDEPLSKIIKVLHNNRLSQFIQEYERCIYAIYNPEYPNELINMNTISTFFNYIFLHGYKINKQLTNVMTSPQMRNNTQGILCFIEKMN